MLITSAMLAAALVDVVTVLATKAIVEPSLKKGLEGFQKKLTGDYDKAKADQEMQDAIGSALDDFGKYEKGDFTRLRATLNLTDLTAETQRAVVTTAVAMVRADPLRIPDELLAGLHLEAADRDWLAEYLARLHKVLEGKEFYQPLIAFANQAEANGLLENMHDEVKQLAASNKAIENYTRALMADRRLLESTERSDKQVFEKYLELGRKDWGGIFLPMIRHRVDDSHSYRLKQIFVPLLLLDKRAEAEARKKAERIQGKAHKPEMAVEEQNFLRPFTELMQRYKTFVVTGKPGSGKTTLFRHTALAFADGSAKDLGWQGGALFPIFIRLRNFGEFLQTEQGKIFCDPGPGAMLEYLKNRYQNSEYLSITADFFSSRLDEGSCLVLLDGLDEVSQEREVVVAHLNAFIKRFTEKNIIGLSSRPGGFGEDERIALRDANLAEAEVAPLDAGGIYQLIKNVVDVMDWEKPGESTAAKEDLPRRILASKDLTSIASIPLFCATLVQVYKYYKAQLPDRRVDVLDEIVTLLLGHWHASQEVTKSKELATDDGTGKAYKDLNESVQSKERRARYLAYHMIVEQQQFEITADDAVQVMTGYFRDKERVKDDELAEKYARGFLHYSHLHSGLLAEMSPATRQKSASFAFIHQNFGEFLAAAEIVNRGKLVDFVVQNIDDPWWEQVILFAGAMREGIDSQRGEIVCGLMESAEHLTQGTQEWSRRLVMAGHLARDMAGHLDGAVREELMELLFKQAIDDGLNPTVRAEVADALDEIYIPDDLYSFVPIPGKDEPAFWLARYPVTNGQYARFLDAEDFAEEKYWLDFPAFAEPQKGYARVGNWGRKGVDWLLENLDERRKVLPRYWGDARFGAGRRNAPVVGVSWYEANAYCQWLAEHEEQPEWEMLKAAGLEPGGVQLRLPTEAEWVQAAGGEEGERYAWGQLSDPQKEIVRYANTEESGLGRTTPVWMYPQGESQPHRLMDMSGNVWEWQANFRDKDHAVLALRGGSWYFDFSYARVAPRGSGGPHYGNDDYGFRLAVFALPH